MSSEIDSTIAELNSPGSLSAFQKNKQEFILATRVEQQVARIIENHKGLDLDVLRNHVQDEAYRIQLLVNFVANISPIESQLSKEERVMITVDYFNQAWEQVVSLAEQSPDNPNSLAFISLEDAQTLLNDKDEFIRSSRLKAKVESIVDDHKDLEGETLAEHLRDLGYHNKLLLNLLNQALDPGYSLSLIEQRAIVSEYSEQIWQELEKILREKENQAQNFAEVQGGLPPLPLIPVIDYTGNYDNDLVVWVRDKYKVWLEAKVLSFPYFKMLDSNLAEQLKNKCSSNKRANQKNPESCIRSESCPHSINDVFPKAAVAKRNQERFYQSEFNPLMRYVKNT